MLHKLPPLGNRILKTAVAVLICLLIYWARGFGGEVTQSTIAAVICVQPYVSDSRTYAIERILGTFIGSMWGFVYLLIMYLFPVLGREMPVAYLVMTGVVVLALYSSVLMKKTGTAALSVIVFLCMVARYPDVGTPFIATRDNLIDTTIGTLVAIAVNTARLPRVRHPEYLFFVRTQDLVPDRYQHIPSALHILLDHLYKDGARICLVTRWAPAFIISQMGLLNVNAPMIVMDGAALYDIRENRYLEVVDIPHKSVERLLKVLKGLGASCSLYTVQERSLCIYHAGPYTQADRAEQKIMQRSPYRNYMDGPYHPEDRVAFIRILDTRERIEALDRQLRRAVPPALFRTVIREEAHFPDCVGLYFYYPTATVPLMKKRLLSDLEQSEPVVPMDILPRTEHYDPTHDAPQLLHRLKETYEPITLFTRTQPEK